MKQPRNVHILGAGIAGLSAACYARRRFPGSRVLVYEAAPVPGGRCRSFFSRRLDWEIDNATHVILGANKGVRKFWQQPDFVNAPVFYDCRTGKTDKSRLRRLPHLLMSVFNTAAADVPAGALALLGRKLFPFCPPQLKLCYSRHNLSRCLVAPLAAAGGELYCGRKLLGVATQGAKISKLCFAGDEVVVEAEDAVISALDSLNYGRIFGGADFAYRRIVNVFFRTSQQVALPGGNAMLGICGGLSHWLFATPGILGVTISNAGNVGLPHEDLAREVWKEVCRIRGTGGAFMPAWQVLDYPRATIAQDKDNNQKRPLSAASPFENLFVAGDWTMKNWPCSLEAAFCSGHRAIKAISF